MITAAPHARRLTLRAAAIGAVTAVLVAGVVSITPPVTPEAAAAVIPPDGSETFQVSQSDTGSSVDPYLTPDGQRVLFTSTAADLVAGDGNGVADIFASVAQTGSDDPFTGAPELVSVPDDSLVATQSNAPSSEPVASADGRYVAFASTATNLVADGGTAGRKSIYVRDTLLGKTFRVQGPAGEPDGQSFDPDISDDGRHLVFTSEAVNLSAGDTNGTRDSFVADLDANSDGIFGDLTVERFLGGRVIAGGTEQARISGTGGNVAFTAHQDSLDQNIPPTITSGDYVYYAWVGSMAMSASLVGTNAHNPTIDAGGQTVAYVDDDECDNAPAIIAATLDSDFYYAALGTIFTDRRVGYIADPVISADGTYVAWTTTVPEYDFAAPASELAEPVVRMQKILWFDSRIAISCFGLQRDWFDLAEGAAPSVSASARTVAFTAPATAPEAVFAMDTHSHEGLSVSSTQGQLVTTGFMTTIDIPTIPLTSLRGYASAIANAPIHNLPIHNLPIHNLPIHNLPIHNLPIHNLPIHNLPIHNLPIHNLAFPGGWAQVLADTPFAAELIQSVTLDEILAWAAATLAAGSGATDAERAAALRIQSLTLGDLGLDGSGLDALTLASYILGAAAIGEVPIAGDGTTLERWQDLVDAQGLGFQVEPAWYLADLDAAGLDIERSGVDAVPLRSLPIDDTLLRYLTMTDLFLTGTPLGTLDVATLDSAARVALFGTEDVTGPLQSQSFLFGTTAADLAAGAPDWVTVGILLMSVLDAASYPWEQISASSFDPNLAEAATDPGGCDSHVRCGQQAVFQYTFDPGPGEATTFAAPTASLTTPAGTASYLQYMWGSGPDTSIVLNQPYTGPKQLNGERLQIALPETAGGTVLSIKAWYTATTQPGPPQAVGELTSGAIAASDTLSGAAPVASFDDPDHNLINGNWQNGFGPGPLMDSQIAYEWIAPQFRELNDEGDTIEGPAQDEDYYPVDPPPAGKRLVVSTNATDGQISLALYAPSAAAATLGVENAGVAPGTPVTEQSGPGGQPAESGADAGADLAGSTLVDQAVVGGDGTAQVEAASVDVPSGQRLLVRVTSGNGQPSAALYSLRVQYIDEAPEVHCSPWAPAQIADPGVIGVSDDVTASTNTVYLFDEKRYGDTYGALAAADVRNALASLTGEGHVGSGAVDGAVLAVDTDPGVQAARTALDLNPCSMEARRALTSAINAFIGAQLGEDRAGISSVVIVGGDDIIPLAPVGQHTSQFTEMSHADDLRLTQTPSGEPCPVGVFIDPCETPLSAAAATSHVLTDDPYGLAKAYESLGGFLYVPTVALGRLVETPDQIMATIARFVDAEGILTADSTLTGGYGAWSELPQSVTEALAWRSPANQQFGDPWTATDLDDSLFPDGGQSARVVSVNTHADETRMLPGVPGASSGSFADADLFGAAGHENAAQLAGALIFGIGCHAGNNLPAAYYGNVTDWVDVFSAAGGYVGNTGYGLANNVTTALGERLLALYADWIGVSVDGIAVSSAGALTYAKQSYLGGLGLYSGYDEKVLMEAVYYGLPMYTFNDADKVAPLPDMPDLTPSTEGGLTTAGLSFHPTFQTHFVTDDDGQEVEYLTVEGESALASPGQPVIASVVKALQPAPTGKVARGALLTSLTSVIDDVGIPAVTAPGVGIPETKAIKAEAAFPSTFATISKQQTPTGPIDLLVVTPSRVQTTQGGHGITERFTDFRAEVVYGDAASTDTTAPTIDAIEVPGPGQGEMTVYASDASGIATVVLLVQPEGETEWQRITVQPPSGETDGWDAAVPTVPFRWILQVVDGAGNVAVETARGHLDIAGAFAPSLGDPGPDVTIAVGQRLLRAVPVTDPQPGDRLTASVVVKDAQGEVVSTSPAAVETGPDGTTRALIDQTLTKSGAYTVKLTVCRGEACTAVSFAVDIPAPNARPSAEVLLESDDVTAQPTSTLTARPTATDPESDAVTLAYAWTRNGVKIPDQTTAELDLDGIAQPGDVIAVTVTPSDAGGAGHAASAELLVVEETAPPAPPTITATATKVGGSPYLEGSWSLSTVTVTFECTAGAALVVPCPGPQTVSDDTPEAGVTVTGTIRDLLGRTATDEVLVKVDRTAPALAPVVMPSIVPVGGTATATPNATDPSSGVASESCADPQTTTAGPASVLCEATDVAGNRGSASASYTVEGPATPPCNGIADRTALPPLNADGSSVFMRPSGVPVVFTACDENGNPIDTKKLVRGFTLISTVPLAPSAGVNELSYVYVGTFKYTKSSGQWQGFIPTNKLNRGGKYTYRVDLTDGSSFTVTFGVR